MESDLDLRLSEGGTGVLPAVVGCIFYVLCVFISSLLMWQHGNGAALVATIEQQGEKRPEWEAPAV